MSTALALLREPTDRTEFLKLFNRLCVALREPADDTGVTQGIYFDALKDLAPTALEDGATVLMKEPGRRFFPTSAEWRTASETAGVERMRRAVQPTEELGIYVCRDCRDSGWLEGIGGEAMKCPGDARCGRRRTHGLHTYTQACCCRASNVNYQRTSHFGAGR